MSEANGTDPGGKILQIDGKDYVFKLTHWKVHTAEQLLGCGLLYWTGGDVSYAIYLSFAILQGQHGIKNREDVAALMDGNGSAIGDAVTWAVLDFYRQYPELAPILKPLQQKLDKKARPQKKRTSTRVKKGAT